MIAGTGRAGTSFLVRFLGACGLDTGEPELFFDARARAGLESNLLDERAPYVVKDPWLFAYCDQIDPDEVEVEALLVPIRDLTAAATSRILQERIAMADSYWSDLPPSDVHGLVAGGAVYSLDPVDEARILAVGFHRLILWATARQIPLFLLEFPRIVTDAEYLVDTLWPWLGSRCDRERAMCAFASVADRDLVRVDGTQVSSPAERASEAENLDRAAMSYLLKEREANLRAARDKVAEFEHRLRETDRRLGDAERHLADTQDRLGASEREAAQAEHRLTQRLAEVEAALAERSTSLDQTMVALRTATDQLAAVQRTWSWRVTRPLRALRGARRRDRGGRHDTSTQPDRGFIAPG